MLYGKRKERNTSRQTNNSTDINTIFLSGRFVPLPWQTSNHSNQANVGNVFSAKRDLLGDKARR